MNKNWSKSPLVVIIGIIVSCIAVYAFVNIKQSVSKLVTASTPEPLIGNSPLGPIDYPTETKTPLLLSIPASTNQSLTLSGSPNDWLIESDELPSEMMYTSGRSYSNEDIANFYHNPAETLRKMEEWGRVTSSWQQYWHEDGCNSKIGLREIILQAILFKESSGAQQTMDWYVSSLEDKETTTIAGESGYIYWQGDESACEPPENLTYVTIIFRRYNALASVDIGSITGTMSDSDMLNLIQQLAQAIDLRLVAEAK